MTPNKLDLDRIEGLARAATPGPWTLVTSSERMRCGIDGGDGSAVVWNSDRKWDGDETGIPRDEDAAYIAAIDPQTVLSLISYARELEGALGGLLRCEYESAGHGLRDCIDNDGAPYQSEHLAEQIKRAEAALSRTQLPPAAPPAPEGKAEPVATRLTMWAEVVETYEGDGVEWRCSEESGRDSDERPTIELAANTFPVGTRVEISEPNNSALSTPPGAP